MSHFTVGIIVPPNIRSIQAFVALQMARYDEALEPPDAARDDDDYFVNPNARWDWYRIGGRWDGWITDNRRSSHKGYNLGKRHESVQNNIATTETALSKNKVPHAIITPDGEWHERGAMGFFGVVSNELPEWEHFAQGILRKHPVHRFVILDAHI